MPSTDTVSQLRERVRGYLSLSVLLLWGVLTLLVAGYVYVSVAPSYGRGGLLGVGVAYPFTTALFGLEAGGAVLAARADRPSYALVGVLFVGLAALPLPIWPCIAPACTGPERLHVFYDWSPLLGPAIAAGHDAGRCVHHCPHRVQLVPLLVGYLFLGETMTAGES